MPDGPTLFDDHAKFESDEKMKSTNNSSNALKKGETLYLADAMALAYRSHFAFIKRPLFSKSGMNTSAVYGFAGSLLKLLEDHSPDHIAVVFDKIGPGGTFRDALYAEYKAHRPPMPDELEGAIPYIKRLVEAFDIPIVEIDGVEADDVIGTIAKEAEHEKCDVVIVSPDKDFRQLLSDHVSMLRPAYRGESFNPENAKTFRETYGLEPLQFIDVLALMGDSADNVPGVPGVGKKTAPKLLQEYGSIEELIENVSDVKANKRVKKGLEEGRKTALLSKELVTILTDVELGDLDWKQLRRTAPNMKEIQSLFDELDFGSRLRGRVQKYAESEGGVSDEGTSDTNVVMETGVPDSLDLEAVTYDIVTDAKELEGIVEKHTKDADVLSFDTETTDTDPLLASLVGVSISSGEGKAAYFPTPLPDGTQTEEVLKPLLTALQDPELPKVAHNAKYDLLVLQQHGVEVQGEIFDTMVAHYLIDADGAHKMDAVAEEVLNYHPQPISELIGKGKDQGSMRDVPVEKAGPYACEDADVTLRLVEPLRERLAADDLMEMATKIEFPLVRVLADMEMKGIRLDTDVLDKIRKTLVEHREEIEEEIFEIIGTEVNIASTQQLAGVLFTPEEEGGLGLRVVEKTSTGNPSTNERVLSELAAEHPLPALILDWRHVSKLLSTYVDKLPELIHPETGRVHTDFNQTVAATGRLSSNNPNLQNIPIRTEMGREIRRAFVADEGWKLLSADYAQIELRIIASMSGDEGLQKAFRAGKDIHAATAARVFGVDYDDVTREQRNHVKQVNYGIPYGISARGLGQRMRIPTAEAKQLIDQYQSSYSRIPAFLEELVESAREKGYAETLLGRRRYIPQLKSRSHRERSYAERIAVNMPIQGTNADMIKKAMVAIRRRFREEGFKARMILQVHDELVLEVPEEELEAVQPLLVEEMEKALPLEVPIEVDVGVADNWLDAH